MPTEPARLPRHPDLSREADTEATAVFPHSSQGVHEARYEEDSFDYPSSPGEQPDDHADAAAGSRTSGKRASRAADTGLWQQVASRHRTPLLALAVVILAGGFVFALSIVSDTVSAPSAPVGGVSSPTATDSVTFEPTVPVTTSPVQPGGAGSVSSPPGDGGTAVSPSPTAVPPSASVGGQDGHRDDGREDHRDDG
ncbi:MULTISPECIES: hypothetical protein [Streptomyces]|uniref:Serine/threonine protein kinase n=1 Tax=Streptomyces mirabilis TaxID=68239 RepID=A0ABU3V0S3_9ACTN|nr:MULTISPECIES: hypothetical protein [Streptomyces]MCX4616342.1 hypothetical protein [Streptomyces mirabilis]MCX5346896.1 hypothetical protein [Streptomyces mirabilis]MDU8999765.1 hypothetical protein [Streptomyces mirabilis]QDN75972.1 hypothetical protein FNV64_10730 [Streptomyces sp. S1A1-7]QDN85634.1 hypothetical protein FNV61_08385 [Streptomyces sp. RLB3-6]